MFICDISMLNRMGKALLNEKLNSVGFVWREMVVLLVLSQKPGATQHFVSQFLQTDKANVSNLIKSLERRQLIKKVVLEEDRRYRGLHLTEKSEALIPQLENVLADWQKHCYEGLSQEELELYEKLNEKIISNMMTTNSE